MQIRQWLCAAVVFLPAGIALSVSLTGQEFPLTSKVRAPDDFSEELRQLWAAPAMSVENLEGKTTAELQAHLRKAKQDRVTALRGFVAACQDGFYAGGVEIPDIGRADLQMLTTALGELARAEADVAETRAERVAAMSRWYDVARQIEETIRAKRQADARGGGDAQMSFAIANRLAAEAALVSELAAKDIPPKPDTTDHSTPPGASRVVPELPVVSPERTAIGASPQLCPDTLRGHYRFQRRGHRR